MNKKHDDHHQVDDTNHDTTGTLLLVLLGLQPTVAELLLRLCILFILLVLLQILLAKYGGIRSNNNSHNHIIDSGTTKVIDRSTVTTTRTHSKGQQREDKNENDNRTTAEQNKQIVDNNDNHEKEKKVNRINDDDNNKKKMNQNRETKRRYQHALTGHLFVMISYYPHYLPIHICLIGLILAVLLLRYIHKYHYECIYLYYFGSYLRYESELYQPSQLPGAYYFLIGTILTVVFFPIEIARYAIECLAISDPLAAYIGQTYPTPKINTILQRIYPSYLQSSSSAAASPTTQTQTTTTTTTNPYKPNENQNQAFITHQHSIKLWIQQKVHATFLSSTSTVSGSIACFISSWIIGWCMLQQPTTAETYVTVGGIVFYIQITLGAFACTISEAYPLLYNDNICIPLVTASVAMFLILFLGHQ